VEESMLVPKLLLHHAPPTGELGHNIGATISGGGPTQGWGRRRRASQTLQSNERDCSLVASVIHDIKSSSVIQ